MTAKPITALLLTLAPLGYAAAIEPPWGYRNITRPPCVDGIPVSRYQYGGRSASAVEVSKTGVLLRRATRVGDVIAPPPPVALSSRYTDQSVRQRADIGGIHLDRSIDHSVQADHYLPPSAWERFRHDVTRNPLNQDSGRDLSLGEQDRGITRKTFRDNFTVNLPPPRQTVIDLYQLDRARIQINHCEISDVAIQLYDDGQWVLSLRADQNRRPEDGGPDGYNPFLHIRRNEFFIRLRCLGAYDHPPMTEVVTNGKPVLADLQPYAFWVENGEPRYVRQHGNDPLVAEHFADIDRVEIEFFYR